MKVFVCYFLLFVVELLPINSFKAKPCNLRKTQYGSVCVCTSQYCDYLVNPTPKTNADAIIVSSSKEGLRFDQTTTQFNLTRNAKVYDFQWSNFESGRKTNFEDLAILVDDEGGFAKFIFGASSGNYLNIPKTSNRKIELKVERSNEYQRIVGFGGAFTGSVSYILQQIDQELQDHIYRSYFNHDGIQFNIIRMSIGGSDFDLEPWAYNEHPRDDTELTNFTKLDARDEIKITQLQRLKEISNLSFLKIMAAAWSPPIWMKTNNNWTGFSQLKNEFYQTWANYHFKFIELMNAKNMPIWAISTGNEPLNGVIGWFFVHFMSLGWTPRNQAIWLSDFLGPTIKNSKHKDVLIFGNDDQRYTYPAWFNRMKQSRPNSLNYLDGLAVHWYWDDVFAPTLIDEAHRNMPNKLLLNTESCIGDKPWQTHGPELGSWERAQQYIRAFLQDLQHAFNGWIDWNIVLNEEGGPNYVKNHVDAPIIVNTTSRTEFYKQPIFYALGHFSKFVPEGSLRIYTRLSTLVNIESVGFKRPDGTIALVVSNSDSASLDVTVSDSIRGEFTVNLPPQSVHTIIYN